MGAEKHLSAAHSEQDIPTTQGSLASRPMDPSVEAALIGAGVAALGILSGTATAIVSSVSTRRASAAALSAATAENIRALDAARDDRLWDRKAVVYVDAIRIINHMFDTRLALVRSARMTEVQTPADPDIDTRLLEAQLQAFAPAPLQDAFRAAVQADAAARFAWVTWRDKADAEHAANEARGAGIPLPAQPGAVVIALRRVVDEKGDQATDAGQTAIDAFSADLGRRTGDDD